MTAVGSAERLSGLERWATSVGSGRPGFTYSPLVRTWAKVTISVVGVAIIAFIALAGTGAYFVFRHLERTSATEADSRRDFDAIRARYKDRPPLIEIVNPAAADIRIHKAPHPEGRRAETMHVLTWDPENGERVSINVPLWLMRFSSVNILSRLGIAPERFQLTAEDVARYGPGIVVDYTPPNQARVLIWVE